MSSNTSLNNSSEPNGPSCTEFKIPTYITIVLGFIVNAFVCISFSYYRRIRTTNNFFVCNLAISALVQMFHLSLLQARESIVKSLPGDDWMKFNVFLRIFEDFGVIASIITVAVISYDRHHAVTKPLHYNAIMTPRKVFLFILCIWLLAAAFSSLHLLLLLPDHLRKYIYKYTYIPLAVFCTMVIPLSVTIYSYTKIVNVALRHSRNNPHQTSNSSAKWLTRKHIKIALYMIVLVAPPLLYWTIYNVVSASDEYFEPVQFNCLSEYFFSMGPSFVATIDPIVYIILTRDFRDIITAWFKCPSRRNFVSETYDLPVMRTSNASLTLLTDMPLTAQGPLQLTSMKKFSVDEITQERTVATDIIEQY